MAGLTVTKVFGPVSIGDRFMTVHTIGFDSSYPTGGEALSSSDLGFSSATDDEFHVEVMPSGGYVFEYDHTNNKVIAYEQIKPSDTGSSPIPLPEVASASDLSAIDSVRVTAYGRLAG